MSFLNRMSTFNSQFRFLSLYSLAILFLRLGGFMLTISSQST